MTITYDVNTDKCQLMAPLSNKGLCYTMLEMARDVVQSFHEDKRRAAAAQAIIKVPPGFDPRMGQPGGKA
jgi:hypothetical protein